MFSFCLLGLTACTTIPNTEKTLNPYLNEFIGKDVQHLKQNIDFRKFDFKSSNRAYSESDQQLTYQILRTLRVPVPMTSIQAGPDRPGPTTNFSASNSYDVDVSCNIRFNVKDNKVVDWTYSGKAC